MGRALVVEAAVDGGADVHSTFEKWSEFEMLLSSNLRAIKSPRLSRTQKILPSSAAKTLTKLRSKKTRESKEFAELT